jgi:Uma2 family endonuclease
MSTVIEPDHAAVGPVAEWLPTAASVFRLNIEKYEAMVRSGVFTKHDRLHLINGILVAKMTKKPSHVIACEKSRDSLLRAIPAGWRVMVEAPVRIPDFSEPEPDIALARGHAEDYEERHPLPPDIALIVEVADSSLKQDRDLEVVYAGGGIQVYWIVNLIDQQVELYSDPGPSGYRVRAIFKSGQRIPLKIDGVMVGEIAVDDMLPRRS